MTTDSLMKFARAVEDNRPVQGLTHCFYRYPARFSPTFARAAIEAFTNVGDIVFDPFMGGGTTLVEAAALGRRGVGTDVNSLAVFLTKVKTTILSDLDVAEIRKWVANVDRWLNLRNGAARATEWIRLGYQRNISGKTTWPIRKATELALNEVGQLQSVQQAFVRCVLLRTAQWALDCRKRIPSVGQFRRQFIEYSEEMLEDIREFRGKIVSLPTPLDVLSVNRSLVGIEDDETVRQFLPPKLVLTSPPYPGVHVLYHRWQVNGRRETPAPFWIANSLDGKGDAHYTLGDRRQRGLENYFKQAMAAYRSLRKVVDRQTLVIQLVAFSAPTWQLPRFLEVLSEAEFSEIRFPEISNSDDGRFWRSIPNRKFYADQRGSIPASKEVLLIHRIS